MDCNINSVTLTTALQDRPTQIPISKCRIKVERKEDRNALRSQRVLDKEYRISLDKIPKCL